MTQRVHKAATPFRLIVVIMAVLLASLILAWRAVDLHVVRKDFLQGQGDARYLRAVPVAAHRGIITDRNGEPLAISTPVDSVWVHPKDFLEAYAEWPRLASLLEMKLQRIQQLVLQRKEREFVYLKRHINPQLAEKVLALNIPGVSLQREYHRYYPAGEVASHVVGFTNVDDTGQEGLELAYDEWLRGTSGEQRVLKDRLGRTIKHIELIRKSSPGKDLTLSIDRRLQYLTYRELKRAVFKHKARSGSAVILDVKTGEVLAMVNQPSYNPNNRRQFKGELYRNRAVTDVFEPGSTIKPFTVAAALASGRFSANSLIDTTPGKLKVSGSTIRDVRNYGRITVARVIEKSSNVGASKMALAIPAEKLWDVHSRVGFGAVSNSGFPGESSGILTHARRWSSIEQATMAFGYGLSVTPLQLARAYAVLANNGRMRPISFLRVDDDVPADQVLSSAIASKVRKMLETVTGEGGTGTKARIAGYRVAGKTGTIKKATVGGYSDERYMAVFAGMVPASAPRLVMVVAINEPTAGVYYGGEVAAPVFSRVMAGAVRLMDIPPDAMKSGKIHVASAHHQLTGARP